MKAYDLWFTSGDGLAKHPGREPERAWQDGAAHGWTGSAGPAIAPELWPRGELTGLPMFHALTLRLPAEYRRRGADLTAISFFQGEGEFAEARTSSTGLRRLLPCLDPFERSARRASDHPRLERRTDILDGQFALIWLTDDEFSRGPVAPPADVRREGEHEAEDGGPNAWDIEEPTTEVWLVEREDPNAGRVPVDAEEGRQDSDYTQPYTDDAVLHPWAEAFATSHLGGTAFPSQAMPEGLTSFYLELEELPGMNFGGGNAQLDLDSETFDWACG